MKSSNKYPIWPIVSLLLCGLLFLIFAWMSSQIDGKMNALNHQANRMQSDDYVVGTMVESFFRGFLGDPFGKAKEEEQKINSISREYDELASSMSFASGGTVLFLLLSLVSGCAWGWRHYVFSNQKQTLPSIHAQHSHYVSIPGCARFEGFNAEIQNAVSFTLQQTNDPGKVLTVGRKNKDCDFVIQNTSISGRHAAFRYKSVGWEIQDLGSSNGTFVNGKQLSAFVFLPIQTGDKIVLGEVILTFKTTT